MFTIRYKTYNFIDHTPRDHVYAGEIPFVYSVSIIYGGNNDSYVIVKDHYSNGVTVRWPVNFEIFNMVTVSTMFYGVFPDHLYKIKLF